MSLFGAMIFLLLSGAPQTDLDECTTLPSGTHGEFREVELIIEIVAWEVEEPLVARKSGCPVSYEILVYESPDGGAPAERIVDYLLQHQHDRVFAKVRGKENAFKYPPPFNKPPAAVLLLSRVFAIWSEPKAADVR